MNAVDHALYDALAAGTALTSALGGTFVYNGAVPHGGSLPCVVFNLQSGVEENLTPTRSDRMVYLVKGIGRTLYQAGQIADMIDDLLHDKTLTVSGFANFWTARETILRYQEIDPTGQVIGHAGGQYAIRIEEN